MKTIKKAYHLKEEPFIPSSYLGATIKQWSIPGESNMVWSMNCQKYVKEAIRCLEIELTKSELTLWGKTTTPLQLNYRPELDMSPLLDPDQVN